jgi:hypothetical protein
MVYQHEIKKAFHKSVKDFFYFIINYLNYFFRLISRTLLSLPASSLLIFL